MTFVAKLLWERISSWRTTSLGISIAVCWEYLANKYLSASCQGELGDLWMHAPAIIVFIVGTFIFKDPAKVEELLGAVRPSGKTPPIKS